MLSAKAPKTLQVAWLVSLLLALAVRIPGLSDRSYYWRELQTEMTSFWFLREGIDLLHYQTPIYGPPWQIPFEFPLYQAASALVARAGIGDLELASRLTALMCFGLSALVLYLLCRRMFKDAPTTVLITSLYLWTPYNIYYSVVPQIDYLSLAFALAYAYFVLVWLERPGAHWAALLATFAGSLLVLVKATTAPIALVPIVAFVLRDVRRRYQLAHGARSSLERILSMIRQQSTYWLTLLFIALVPLALGSMWTRHADQIKSTSVYTQWLMSGNLTYWNYGTLAQRIDPEVWIDHINYAIRFLWPYGLSLLAFLGLLGALGVLQGSRDHTDVSVFVFSVAGGIALTLIIFLNLYLHDYYYIALSASMAILGGFGIRWFWRLRPLLGRAHLYIFAALATVFLFGNALDFLLFRNAAISRDETRASTATWGKQLQQSIPVDQWAIFVQTDWNPIVPFFVERKAMVVTKRETGMPICGILADPRFSLVVITDRSDPDNVSNLSRVLECFKSTTEIAPGAYKVSH